MTNSDRLSQGGAAADGVGFLCETVGVAVVSASEETELLLEVVPLPQRQPVKLLDRHTEDAEELLLGQVPLEGQEHHCPV